MNEQNPTLGKINVEALMERVAELESQNEKLKTEIHELKTSSEDSERAYNYVAKENDKFRKALAGIKNVAEIMLP